VYSMMSESAEGLKNEVAASKLNSLPPDDVSFGALMPEKSAPLVKGTFPVVRACRKLNENANRGNVVPSERAIGPICGKSMVYGGDGIGPALTWIDSAKADTPKSRAFK